MSCVLSQQGTGLWTGATGAQVTVSVIADNTKVTAAFYNQVKLSVTGGKSTVFTLVEGWEPLTLVFLPVEEDVTVVEVGSAGDTQDMWDNDGDAEIDVSLWIKGV